VIGQPFRQEKRSAATQLSRGDLMLTIHEVVHDPHMHSVFLKYLSADKDSNG
jgi:hypothetical protein